MPGSSRPFLDFLREQRSGALHDELSDQLQELVAACIENKKAGKLTIAITVKPEGDVVMVHDVTKLVLPKVVPSPSVFFATPDNNLSRMDPRQSSMELRALPSIPAGMTKVI